MQNINKKHEKYKGHKHWSRSWSYFQLSKRKGHWADCLPLSLSFRSCVLDVFRVNSLLQKRWYYLHSNAFPSCSLSVHFCSGGTLCRCLDVPLQSQCKRVIRVNIATFPHIISCLSLVVAERFSVSLLQPHMQKWMLFPTLENIQYHRSLEWSFPPWLQRSKELKFVILELTVEYVVWTSQLALLLLYSSTMKLAQSEDFSVHLWSL